MFRYRVIYAATLLGSACYAGAQQITDNKFNPAISLILSGTYADLSESPADYALTGFVPSDGEVAPSERGFSLAESELILSANIDPYLYGQITVALEAENEVAVEEAWIQTLQLGHGTALRAGRFFSAIGYINEQHSHVWDFVDAPLAQKAFLGGQYGNDGVQFKWLAPTDTFIELGFEAGSGKNFPGSERDKNGAGSWAAYVHAGDDINVSHNWRAGISYLQHDVQNREFDDNNITNTFSGDSTLWIVDAIWKWAPDGNSLQTNFKLQGEYYWNEEAGTLTYDTTGAAQSDSYSAKQSGWYLQAIYQFMPHWRAGVRYDRLQRGTINAGAIDLNNIPVLADYNPTRQALMLDYSPSEFSRLRLQLAQDKSRANVTDDQLMLQYVVSLGAHGAHKY